MNDKRLIFVLSPGRCGTAYLASVLATIPGVTALHEPHPVFTDPFRAYMGNRAALRQWWQDYKLPSISAQPGSVYICTSHMFVKGFVEPLLELGEMPDVIILRRPAREVALSLWRMGCIPARTAKGLKYLYKPNDPGVLDRFFQWNDLTDYGMCYWYAKEIETRQSYYRPLFDTVYETTTGEIISQDHFLKLVQAMGLPQPDMEQYNAVKNTRVNGTEPWKMDYWPPCWIGAQERMVEHGMADPA
jgi:hypothetical protein